MKKHSEEWEQMYKRLLEFLVSHPIQGEIVTVPFVLMLIETVFGKDPEELFEDMRKRLAN